MLCTISHPRGDRREAIHEDDEDRQRFWDVLAEVAERYNWVAETGYPWSSYRRHAGIANRFGWLDIDPCYEALGFTDDERATRYREFVRSAIPVGEWEIIREALQRGQLTGTERFVGEVEAIVGRRIENRRQGRPRKEAAK